MAEHDGDVAYLVGLGWNLDELKELGPEAIAALAQEERLRETALAGAAPVDPPVDEPLRRAGLRARIADVVAEAGLPPMKESPTLDELRERIASALTRVIRVTVTAEDVKLAELLASDEIIAPPSGPPVCVLCRMPHLFGSGSCVR